MKLVEIGLSGKETDVESLQMSHRIRLLCHRVQNSSRLNHQSRHRDRHGVDQRGSSLLRPFCLYVGHVWSNHYNLNISPIYNETINVNLLFCSLILHVSVFFF